MASYYPTQSSTRLVFGQLLPPVLYDASPPKNGMSSARRKRRKKKKGMPSNGLNHISPPGPYSPPQPLAPGPPPRPSGSSLLPRPPGPSAPPRPHGLDLPPRPPGPGPQPLGFGPPPRPPGLSLPSRPPVPGPPPWPHALSPHSFGGSPQKQTPKSISFGLIICIAVVLLQTVLMITRADLLKPFIDIESPTRHVSVANSTLAAEKGKMEHEKEAMTRERELWEKAREDRVPRGAFWEDVLPAWSCHGYGKREYWGVLRNIPEGWSEIDACMNMPVEIKGVTVRRPYRCAPPVGSPHIRGYWMVDWDQPDCKPWYRDYKEAGCTHYRSGKRKIEAQIVGIDKKRQKDWLRLCNSTPLVWNLTTYTSPTHCEERARGRKVAMWEVLDESCL